MKKRMFNDKFKLTDMVIQRRKTMTSDILPELGAETKLVGTNDKGEFEFRIGSNYETVAIKPKFKVGEVVAVAQSYETVYNNTSLIRVNLREYMFNKYAGTTPWNNKMYVRPDLMPHQIRIEKVICERLQEISDEDCIKEGILKQPFNDFPEDMYLPYQNCKEEEVKYTPRYAFAELINKIFGKDTWEKNPYRIGYEFTLIK
ncbi:MAG: hypothetical protein K5885_02480 [Bacteroidales bacterium]|nr:hypothetical protein [Bacteroidales bacterium]